MLAKNALKGHILMKLKTYDVKVDIESVHKQKHALNVFKKKISSIMERCVNANRENFFKIINAAIAVMDAQIVPTSKPAQHVKIIFN